MPRRCHAYRTVTIDASPDLEAAVLESADKVCTQGLAPRRQIQDQSPISRITERGRAEPQHFGDLWRTKASLCAGRWGSIEDHAETRRILRTMRTGVQAARTIILNLAPNWPRIGLLSR